MSFTQVCIHYVWATKYREPLLVQPYRRMLFEHIRENAIKQNIYIDRLNGYVDHVHCLVWLRDGQSFDVVAKLLKGESTFWFNKYLSDGAGHLRWQKGYFAVSVSLHMVARVRAYIDKQEEHHRKKQFQEEYDKMMKQHLLIPGFEKDLSDEM